jgi:hypothetical protein
LSGEVLFEVESAVRGLNDPHHSSHQEQDTEHNAEKACHERERWDRVLLKNGAMSRSEPRSHRPAGRFLQFILATT